MKTQREFDVLKTEQKMRFAGMKENILKQHLGDRYALMPAVPPGTPMPEPGPEAPTPEPQEAPNVLGEY